ncbi:uncharacterized protein [Bemisia tabaci]|uniref:uncharacterized protein n=1 Tax=Bemisia tabaci TaxID=7038 RepID=UPI003B27C22C
MSVLSGLVSLSSLAEQRATRKKDLLRNNVIGIAVVQFVFSSATWWYLRRLFSCNYLTSTIATNMETGFIDDVEISRAKVDPDILAKIQTIVANATSPGTPINASETTDENLMDPNLSYTIISLVYLFLGTCCLSSFFLAIGSYLESQIAVLFLLLTSGTSLLISCFVALFAVAIIRSYLLKVGACVGVFGVMCWAFLIYTRVSDYYFLLRRKETRATHLDEESPRFIHYG